VFIYTQTSVKGTRHAPWRDTLSEPSPLYKCHRLVYALSLVLSFQHYLAEHAHFSSLKQLYGLHLCLYIYWYSTVVVLFQTRN